MAKQKGIIKLKGSLGGITFYQRNGEDLSRTTNGPTKSKIDNDPAFKRTRENNQEFAGAATAGKAIRMGLVVDFDEMADTNATARLVKVCKEIISRAPGVRGQRPFMPQAYKDPLISYIFDQSVSFDSIFLAHHAVAVNPDRNTVTITIPDFNTGNFVDAPSGATHFKVINLIAVLSQYDFNPASKKYEPVDLAINSQNGFNASDYLPVGGNVGAVTTIIAGINNAPVLPATSVLISCIGIEFYQDVSGVKYLLSSSNAMKIQNVY